MFARRCAFCWTAVPLLLVTVQTAWGTGVLIPSDKSVEPLGIVYQRLEIDIHEQAAVTKVVQEFRNHTGRDLEAHYCFPLPKNAGIKDFAMWIGSEKVTGEVVEADKARKVYEDIVRRMKDPGLLEHMGQNLWRVRVYPVPANGTQKIEISYSELLTSDAGIAEYNYPLRAGNKSLTTEKDFTLKLNLHSSIPLKSVYSPTHDVELDRESDSHAVVAFEQHKYTLNRDFRLFWTVSNQAVGLSTLAHREDSDDKGYFMALISPPTTMKKQSRVARDLVFVVDTSGSMRGEKMEQAKKALKFCLNSLEDEDRFAVLGFSTSVHAFKEKLVDGDKQNRKAAGEWIKELDATGGTAIDDALRAALDYRHSSSRNFTVVFLTDGLPTIGQTDVSTIVKNVEKRSSEQTRIFSFGVGDDVNTHLLDQLASNSQATSVYVRQGEDIETKVSSFYSKISHPVLTNLKLHVEGKNIELKDIYPPKLPDLFHGSQLTVLGRYTGKGKAVLKLEGRMGDEDKSFTYDVKFPKREREHDFVTGIWAHRKVGYLLDQIRLNGENSELVQEVVRLAKRHGIATPYTSFLVVPDEVQLAQNQRLLRGVRQLGRSIEPRGGAPGPVSTRFSLGAAGKGGAPARSAGRAKSVNGVDGLQSAPEGANAPAPVDQEAESLISDLKELDEEKLRIRGIVRSRELGELQMDSGAQAVDVAQQLAKMKDIQSFASAGKNVSGIHVLNLRGVWVDTRFQQDAPKVRVKYLSNAYFRLLELHPELKEILALGDAVVWMTPSGHSLWIGESGDEDLDDAQIESWFVKPRADEKPEQK